MKTYISIKSEQEIGDIEGGTLEERAKLVLLTLGNTDDEICNAYRKLAKRYHPDINPNTELWKFQIVNEAYNLLLDGKASKCLLLKDDQLILKITGLGCVKPLLDRQKQWKEYETWRRNHFYGVGVV